MPRVPKDTQPGPSALRRSVLKLLAGTVLGAGLGRPSYLLDQQLGIARKVADDQRKISDSTLRFFLDDLLKQQKLR